MEKLITGALRFAPKTKKLSEYNGIRMLGSPESNSVQVMATDTETALTGSLQFPRNHETKIEYFDVYLPRQTAKALADWVGADAVLEMRVEDRQLFVKSYHGEITLPVSESVERFIGHYWQTVGDDTVLEEPWIIDSKYLDAISKLPVTKHTGWNVRVTKDKLTATPETPLDEYGWTVALPVRTNK